MLHLAGGTFLEHLNRFWERTFFSVLDPFDNVAPFATCTVADPFVLLTIDAQRRILVVMDWAEPNQLIAVSVLELGSVALNELNDVRFSLDPVDFHLVNSGHDFLSPLKPCQEAEAALADSFYTFLTVKASIRNGVYYKILQVSFREDLPERLLQ